MKPTSQNSAMLPQLRVGDVKQLTDILAALAEQLPERTTISQMTAFMGAAVADMMGSPATLTQLKETLGPRIGRSVHTTYQVFLDRDIIRNDRPDVKGVGWLTQESDRRDHRKRYLRLTPRGRSIIQLILEEIDGNQNQD
jgi:hypothetical protein